MTKDDDSIAGAQPARNWLADRTIGDLRIAPESSRKDFAPCRSVLVLRGEQLLQPRDLAREVETKLVALVFGQPSRHLREYHLVITKRALIPWQCVDSGLRSGENRVELGADHITVGFRRAHRRAVAHVETQLFRSGIKQIVHQPPRNPPVAGAIALVQGDSNGGGG